MPSLKTLVKNLGPGLLFASMAIGTSHLVLSTKAGAQYGWVMVIPIILANILKYPFFEFGIRYTTVTNTSLIEGYRNRGKRISLVVHLYNFDDHFYHFGSLVCGNSRPLH